MRWSKSSWGFFSCISRSPGSAERACGASPWQRWPPCWCPALLLGQDAALDAGEAHWEGGGDNEVAEILGGFFGRNSTAQYRTQVNNHPSCDRCLRTVHSTLMMGTWGKVGRFWILFITRVTASIIFQLKDCGRGCIEGRIKKRGAGIQVLRRERRKMENMKLFEHPEVLEFDQRGEEWTWILLAYHPSYHFMCMFCFNFRWLSVTESFIPFHILSHPSSPLHSNRPRCASFYPVKLQFVCSWPQVLYICPNNTFAFWLSLPSSILT